MRPLPAHIFCPKTASSPCENWEHMQWSTAARQRLNFKFKGTQAVPNTAICFLPLNGRPDLETTCRRGSTTAPHHGHPNRGSTTAHGHRRSRGSTAASRHGSRSASLSARTAAFAVPLVHHYLQPPLGPHSLVLAAAFAVPLLHHYSQPPLGP